MPTVKCGQKRIEHAEMFSRIDKAIHAPMYPVLYLRTRLVSSYLSCPNVLDKTHRGLPCQREELGRAQKLPQARYLCEDVVHVAAPPPAFDRLGDRMWVWWRKGQE